MLGSVASVPGKAAASTASGVASVTDGDAIGRQAKQLVDPNTAQIVQEDVTSYLKASITGDKAEASAAKARAVDGLARTANMTPAEAQARIDRAEASARQQYQVAKDKAKQAADAARSGVATASILGVFALLLGAVAGWFAGAAGAGAARARQDQPRSCEPLNHTIGGVAAYRRPAAPRRVNGASSSIELVLRPSSRPASLMAAPLLQMAPKMLNPRLR